MGENAHITSKKRHQLFHGGHSKEYSWKTTKISIKSSSYHYKGAITIAEMTLEIKKNNQPS